MHPAGTTIVVTTTTTTISSTMSVSVMPCNKDFFASGGRSCCRATCGPCSTMGGWGGGRPGRGGSEGCATGPHGLMDARGRAQCGDPFLMMRSSSSAFSVFNASRTLTRVLVSSEATMFLLLFWSLSSLSFLGFARRRCLHLQRTFSGVARTSSASHI